MLQRAEIPARLTGVDASRAFFAECMTREPGETLWVAHLDGQARCIRLARYPRGSRASAYPLGPILGEAARLGSAGLVMALRSAREDKRPSDSDRDSARKLALAADAMGVTLLDHLTFAGANCLSMRRMGLL